MSITSAIRRGIALGAVCYCLLLAGPARADDVNWRTDYNKARQEANTKGLPLLIDIGAEKCFWCKKLDTHTFSDPAVAALLNERFVPLKVDADKSPFLAKALRIESYPTIVFSSADGKIVGYQSGFIEPVPFKERLQQVLGAIGAPDWMMRDFQEVGKALSSTNYPRALELLRGIVEDGKDRPVQTRARALIEELERQATERFGRAKQLSDQGKAAEALAAINDLAKTYPGTQAVRDGKQLQGTLTSRPTVAISQRTIQARDLMRQAREDYRNQQFLCCLDRCEALSGQFADLPEGRQAGELADEIKGNPEWTRRAAEQLADRLTTLYFTLADSYLKKGQPQQAIYYLERIVQGFPTSRHAETAQARLLQLRGAPTRGTARN